jgi:hypothetical protein
MKARETPLIKKGKIIKRVYVRGRETTVSSFKKQLYAKRHAANALQSLITMPRPVIIDNYELPSYNDACRLTLMVKDPFWIFAYWEITPSCREALINKFGKDKIEQAKVVLRMYNVTLVDFNGANANFYFDIEVGQHANNWYINLWHDNVSYIAEVGLRFNDGKFVALARSNCAQTPRAGYSHRSEQIWMKVTDEGYQPPYATAFKPVKTGVSYHTPSKKRAVYLREDEIRHYYSRLSPLLRDIISIRLGRMYGRRGKQAFLLEGETEEERRKILSRLPHIKKLMSGSSQELFLGSSENIGGASEFVLERRNFFFELATELIVYGRTEPDAQLSLGDRKIALNKDGTFNLRFALSDGKAPLEFKAVSADKKESRSINTYVERNTTYDNK